MITSSERAYIIEHAYVPEHLPHYVTAISQTEPFVIDDFVVHVAGSRLVFVGYALNGEFNDEHMLEALETAKARFKPTVVSIIAPAIPGALKGCAASLSDEYYRIDLSSLVIPQKTENMLKRARRDASVCLGKFDKEHERLVKDLIRARRLDKPTQFIFQRLPEYVKCETAIVYDARTIRGDLAAFDVAEYGAGHYAFYLFNFRSRRHIVPGASDVLFAHVLERSIAEGKQYLNLGLGVDAGITFFKKKWGATPFLPYVTCMQDRQPQSPWTHLLDSLS